MESNDTFLSDIESAKRFEESSGTNKKLLAQIEECKKDLEKMHCPYCDVPGGMKTYRHQICMPIGGKVRCIDHCIHHIVAALNAGGVGTVSCCCGHKKSDGFIELEDGRTLVIKPKDSRHA